jgi:pimeloyl-ACP methyl ester carboxylesterase
LRGYAPSSAPTAVSAYRARHLVEDVAGLVQWLGAPIDVLVAHDWGGAVAWNLAAQHPGLIRELVILNAPHPATLLKALQTDPAQQAASAYMLDLVRDDAEERLARDDHAALAAFFTATSEVSAAHRMQWRSGLTGALNFYRASPLRPPQGPEDPVLQLALPDGLIRVEVPTTVLWGEADPALRPVLLDGLEQWVPRLRVRRLPGVGHWVPREAPEALIEEVAGALDRARPRG